MEKERKVIRVNWDEGVNAVEVTAGALLERAAEKIEQDIPRSAFRAGVLAAARELLEDLEERGEFIEGRDQVNVIPALSAALLNGAPGWTEYSAGGCSLVYSGDIAERYLPPSKRTPARWGDLLAIQATGLYYAGNAIKNAAIELSRRA